VFAKSFLWRVVLAVVALWSVLSQSVAASSCVWKVIGLGGSSLYLGGSVHALNSTDYPLPPAYNRAFDASTRMACEVDAKDLSGSGTSLLHAGQYPKGDSLKNHVDPRTYAYLRRLFALMKIPEEKFSKYRPWLLVLLLDSPTRQGLSEDLGVDEFLMRRAKANSKPVVGLESSREHSQIFSGLNDRQSEALLLLTFIPQEHGSQEYARTISAWRRGDADTLARITNDSFRDFPSFGDRLLGGRNRNWIPKIEAYLRSGQTYFVVVGAAHLGGPGGLLALLRGRGYRIEQL
jgi:uncharacterized protein